MKSMSHSKEIQNISCLICIEMRKKSAIESYIRLISTKLDGLQGVAVTYRIILHSCKLTPFVIRILYNGSS